MSAAAPWEEDILVVLRAKKSEKKYLVGNCSILEASSGLTLYSALNFWTPALFQVTDVQKKWGWMKEGWHDFFSLHQAFDLSNTKGFWHTNNYPKSGFSYKSSRVYVLV